MTLSRQSVIARGSRRRPTSVTPVTQYVRSGACQTQAQKFAESSAPLELA